MSERMSFREHLLLPGEVEFGSVMEPWQAADFAALDSAEVRHAYLERPRGHAKTSDVAIEALVELFTGGADRRLYCAAADEDQARILFEDVLGHLGRRPDLAKLVRVDKTRITVKLTRSRLEVISSDAPSAYGLRPDWLALDELAEWKKRALWDSLWSAMAKRPNSRALVISTAGWDRTSIAWEVRQIAESEENWLLSSRGQCATWINPADLAQQQRTLPPHVYARLHLNQWVEGVGAFLTAAEVESVFGPMPPAGPGKVAIGLDIGLTKDRSVASVVREAGGLYAVERLTTWAGTPEAKVDLTEVEEAVYTLASTHKCPVIFDPFQAIQMAQRLRKRGIICVEYAFTATTRQRLFGRLLDLVRRAALRAEPHEDLRRELLGLEARQTASGWRADHRQGRHDDHVVSVGLAAQHLLGAGAVRDFKEADRPEGDPELDRISSGGYRENMIPTLRERVLEKYGPEKGAQKIAWVEANIEPSRQAAYLEELAERDTLSGRLRRAGMPEPGSSDAALDERFADWPWN